VAHAAFPRGNPYLQIADCFGTIYRDAQFAALFPTHGQPAAAPARLALVTVLQFAEGLSDRQAADAVRSRIDWKYGLALDLTDPGFDHTVLSEFRTRLVAGGAEQQLLDTLLNWARLFGVLKARGRQRTDSTHVVAAVRALNRLERVGETLRAALNSLAVVAPEWLRDLAPSAWYERYGPRVDNYRLPKSDAAREALAATIGGDGVRLLRAVDAAQGAPWLREVPAVKTLRRVWAQQDEPAAPADPDAHPPEMVPALRWRPVRTLAAAATLIASPYDVEARWSTKLSVEWVGYKVQVTETCDPSRPRLITNVETTPATTPDDNMVTPVHASLARRALLPGEHLVDKGYTDSHVLVESERQYGVTLVGPLAAEPSWQAREGKGFTKSRFVVDWERRVVTCPTGQQSLSWLPSTYPQKGTVWEVRFPRRACTPCPVRALCTRVKREPRILGLRAREQEEALLRARQHQTTAAFRERYAARAGVEATHAQGIRRCGLRQARYIGLARTHLQHVATAAALNLVRLGEWWLGTPVAKTRRGPFARLQPAA
jgi:transposase